MPQKRTSYGPDYGARARAAAIAAARQTPAPAAPAPTSAAAPPAPAAPSTFNSIFDSPEAQAAVSRIKSLPSSPGPTAATPGAEAAAARLRGLPSPTPSAPSPSPTTPADLSALGQILGAAPSTPSPTPSRPQSAPQPASSAGFDEDETPGPASASTSASAPSDFDADENPDLSSSVATMPTPDPAALSHPSYPETPRSTPAGATSSNPSPADGASTFNQIFQKQMDDYQNKQSYATDLQAAGPDKPKVGWGRKLLAALVGGAEGYAEGGAKGAALGRTVMDAPQEQANTRWSQQVEAAKGDVADTMNQIKMGMDEQKTQADTQDAGVRQGQLTLDQQKQKDQVAQWDKEDKLKQQDADDPWKNISGTDRMLVVSKEVGPDGKPTPRAVTAAAAYKQFYQDEIKKVQAAAQSRNPDDLLKVLESHISNLQTQQQHFETERTRLETSNAAQLNADDPAYQKQVKDLNDSITQIDAEVADARQLAKGKLGIKDGTATGPGAPGAAAAPAAGAAPAASAPAASQPQPPRDAQGRPPVSKIIKNGAVTGYRMQDGSIQRNPAVK